MTDAGATGQGVPTTAVLVQDMQSRRPSRVEDLRAAVVAALARLGTPMVFTADLDAKRYIERIDPASRIVVIAESPGALAAARADLAEDIDITYCLLVAPTSFAHWGSLSAEWTAGLDAASRDHVILLTDSNLARAVVEQQVHGTRADVRVLQPVESAAPSADVEQGWSFQAAAADDRGDVGFSGVAWDFGPAEAGPAPVGNPSVHAEDTLAANAHVMRAIVAPRPLAGRPLRVGVLGHKLTFIDELARDLAHASGSSVVLDEWKHLGAPSDAARAKRIVAQSDVVVGEWGRPNNVWIQNHAAPDTRLIVRVHRYEVTTEFPRAIDMNRFDAGVVIVPWVGRALVQKFGWPAEKLVYIPNYVNSEHYRRPKLPGAEFTLGLVGITPDLKRLDLALNLLGRLRERDTRYSLRVRGQLPPEHIHWAKNPKLAEQWGSVLARLRADPNLRNAVHFDEPGRDMARWYESVGVILSTSDLEGSHVALAEGMASGALPVARPWPGIRTLWPSECVFDRIEDAEEWVLRSRDPQWRAEAVSRFAGHPALDQERVLRAWWDLMHGRREQAQAAFGPIDWHAPWFEPVDR